MKVSKVRYSYAGVEKRRALVLRYSNKRRRTSYSRENPVKITARKLRYIRYIVLHVMIPFTKQLTYVTDMTEYTLAVHEFLCSLLCTVTVH